MKGDPEHAGAQYRPADDIVAAKTVYLFPRPDAAPRRDVDYPWVGQTHVIGDATYSVVHMNHPANPKGMRYSAYRDYGRFGAFVESDLSAERPLRLTFQFDVFKGGPPSREEIDERWERFAAR